MLLSQKHIDTHVHCRDENLSYKSTIGYTASLAKKNDIIAFIDMPNNNPPTISLENVETRIRLAEFEGCLDGYYLNIGLTNNPEQIKKAAKIATEHPKVAGLKYFTTGKKEDVLAIVDEDSQLKLFETLAACDYRGVITPHCEKESLFNKGNFNPKEPWTWNNERPPDAEEEAVKDQIKFAMESEFEGHIHIPHISSPMSIHYLWKYSKMPKFELSGEFTPHHLLRTTENMIGEDGLDLKTNPPVRKMEVVEQLWKKLKEFASVKNRHDSVLLTIGSDNAPHTLKEKRESPYMSGYQSLLIYNDLLNEMKRRGFTEGEINSLTYLNAKKIFPKINE